MKRARRNSAIGLMAAALCALAAPAYAHAFLAHADPAVGATVHGPVTVLRLRFTERVEPALCGLSLADAAHHLIPLSALNTEGDGRILFARLTAPLTPGAYQVHWRAVSIDTHITEGDYGFIVAP